MLNKTKEFTTSQKRGCWDFWGIANSVLNKGKSVIPPLFNGLDSVVFYKAKLFAKDFSKNSILDDQISLYLFSLLELIWNCKIFW